MWQQGIDLLFFQQGSNFALGVIQIAKYANRIHAGSDTGRLFAFGDIIVTEAAFFDDPFFVGLAHVIRAGHHAHFAADAFLGVDVHDAVGGFVSCFCGAHRLARGIVTMHALHREDFLFDFGILTFFAELQTVVETIRRQLPRVWAARP